MAEFEVAYPWAIPHEDYDLSGKITPEPNGGWARFGINSKAHPEIKLEDLTPASAKQIMKRSYWDHFRLGEIRSQAIASKIFDMIINCEYNAVKIVQRAVGAAADGGIGDKTLALIDRLSVTVLMPLLCQKQAEHYQDEYEQEKKKGKQDEYPIKSLLNRAALVPPKD